MVSTYENKIITVKYAWAWAQTNGMSSNAWLSFLVLDNEEKIFVLLSKERLIYNELADVFYSQQVIYGHQFFLVKSSWMQILENEIFRC